MPNNKFVAMVTGKAGPKSPNKFKHYDQVWQNLIDSLQLEIESVAEKLCKKPLGTCIDFSVENFLRQEIEEYVNVIREALKALIPSGTADVSYKEEGTVHKIAINLNNVTINQLSPESVMSKVKESTFETMSLDDDNDALKILHDCMKKAVIAAQKSLVNASRKENRLDVEFDLSFPEFGSARKAQTLIDHFTKKFKLLFTNNFETSELDEPELFEMDDIADNCVCEENGNITARVCMKNITLHNAVKIISNLKENIEEPGRYNEIEGRSSSALSFNR